MHHYASASVALRELKEKGYTVDFNLRDEEILANREWFTIEHVYRYEGDSNPDDESTVYGIAAKDGSKGVYVVGDLSIPGKKASLVLHQMLFENQK